MHMPESLRRRYPDACRAAPTYTPLLTSDMTPADVETAREEGLASLQRTIEATRLSKSWATYFSASGIPLLLRIPPLHGRPCLTLENYCKWYDYHLVSVDAKGVARVDAVSFLDAEPLLDFKRDGSALLDHCPNPKAMVILATHRGWAVDGRAYEMAIGRWEIDYTQRWMTSP